MEEKKSDSARKKMRQKRRIEKAKHVSAFVFVFLCAVLAVAFLPGLRGAMAGNTSVLESRLVIINKPQVLTELSERKKPVRAGQNVSVEGTESVGQAGYIASDYTYTSANVSIEIEKISKGGNTYFTAHVVIKNTNLLRTGIYTNELGKVVKKDVLATAKQNKAVLAINTDFYTYRDSGNIIRNGNVILNKGWGETLCIYDDGSMDVVNGLRTDVYDMLDKGVVNSFNFGPTMIKNGEIITENITGSIVRDARHPRTGVGYYGPGDYLFICVDGRKQGYSNGMTIAEFAKLFKDYGVSLAYNFDGGGSTTMAFMGKLVNLPQGDDKYLRSVDGILYIADGVYP